MDGENEEAAPRCRLSDPAHPHTLCRRDNPLPSFCYRCGPIGKAEEDSDSDHWHYYCEICKRVFHESCDITPQGTRHPYHPNHPLYFTIRFSETRIRSFKYSLTRTFDLLMEERDLQMEAPDLFVDEPAFDENVVFESDNACHWCEKELGRMFYRCLDCNFRLDFGCMPEDPPLTITNLESHQHPLTLFPRPLTETCIACGLSGNGEIGYACDPCNYLVHQKCIDSLQVKQDHHIADELEEPKETDEV